MRTIAENVIQQVCERAGELFGLEGYEAMDLYIHAPGTRDDTAWTVEEIGKELSESIAKYKDMPQHAQRVERWKVLQSKLPTLNLRELYLYFHGAEMVEAGNIFAQMPESHLANLLASINPKVLSDVMLEVLVCDVEEMGVDMEIIPSGLERRSEQHRKLRQKLYQQVRREQVTAKPSIN